MGGRLLGGRVFFRCSAWRCATPRRRSLLVSLAQEILPGGIPLALVFTLWTDVGAVWPGVNNDITTSGRWFFLQSTRN